MQPEPAWGEEPSHVTEPTPGPPAPDRDPGPARRARTRSISGSARPPPGLWTA
ncbi:hypothetical protein GCM10023178_60980 [Actinomadura luteofluorescens]